MSKTLPLLTYLVAFSLSHDGRDYAADSTIELDAAAAAPLLEAGAIALRDIADAGGLEPISSDVSEAERLRAQLADSERLNETLRRDLAERDEALEEARKHNAETGQAHAAALTQLKAQAEADLADAKKAHAAELEAARAQLTAAQASLAAATAGKPATKASKAT